MKTSLFVITLLLLFSVQFSHAQTPKFNIGDKVQANSNLNVRSSPGGSFLGTQSAGIQGTVTSGPVYAIYGGTYYNWYQVSWPTSPTSGWSIESGLDNVTITPTISSVSPNPATGSNSAQTITLNGTGFVSGCTVTLRGVSFSGTYPNISTTFISSTQITISVVLGTDPSTWSAQVINPNASQSNQSNFSVNAPFPVITSLSPSSAIAGSGAFQLTVNGSTFTSSSVVRWNGSNRITKATITTGGLVIDLQASILTSDIASQGTAQVTVFNPSPGGGTSSAVTFTINSAITATRFLSCPIPNRDPYTVLINSVFDHSMTAPYTADQVVIAYTGETGRSQYGQDYVTTINGQALYGFKNSTASNFTANGHYSGGGSPSYLYYDGHPGIDFKTKDQNADGRINVLAAASGIAHVVVESAYNTIYIDHENGYTTYYLHLSQRVVSEGSYVNQGAVIGISGDIGSTGNPHLHFEVKKNGIEVDPYGWSGSGPDPYTRETNTTLWLSTSVPTQNYEIPREFSLFQNYPNPFNGCTTIRYILPQTDRITITIYNSLGQIVLYLLYNNLQEAGEHSVAWNVMSSSGIFVTSGFYFYRITTSNGLTHTKRMVLIK
jgi:murein DD-endopeptidase MepM/ murein hydrolase activator NlpD